MHDGSPAPTPPPRHPYFHDGLTHPPRHPGERPLKVKCRFG